MTTKKALRVLNNAGFCAGEHELQPGLYYFHSPEASRQNVPAKWIREAAVAVQNGQAPEACILRSRLSSDTQERLAGRIHAYYGALAPGSFDLKSCRDDVRSGTWDGLENVAFFLGVTVRKAYQFYAI